MVRTSNPTQWDALDKYPHTFGGPLDAPITNVTPRVVPSHGQPGNSTVYGTYQLEQHDSGLAARMSTFQKPVEPMART